MDRMYECFTIYMYSVVLICFFRHPSCVKHMRFSPVAILTRYRSSLSFEATTNWRDSCRNPRSNPDNPPSARSSSDPRNIWATCCGTSIFCCHGHQLNTQIMQISLMLYKVCITDLNCDMTAKNFQKILFYHLLEVFMCQYVRFYMQIYWNKLIYNNENALCHFNI